MRKQTKYLIGLGALIIILVAAVVVYNSQKTTSFKKVVTDKININEISAIYITQKSSGVEVRQDEIKIEDREEINKIMAEFDKLDLKNANDEKMKFDPYTYNLRIYINKEARFGIDIYNKFNISLYDSSKTKNKLSDYSTDNTEIISKLENYFK
ncbi:hypothetical protein NYE24_24245 [Paenibacillus sp. FSL H7-0350]|uniref:hypothetical protein n=1 Tax=Paenibacillus sp. FSL H7-0350 TaxID=2975345 RepID=UPI0031592707